MFEWLSPLGTVIGTCEEGVELALLLWRKEFRGEMRTSHRLFCSSRAPRVACIVLDCCSLRRDNAASLCSLLFFFLTQWDQSSSRAERFRDVALKLCASSNCCPWWLGDESPGVALVMAIDVHVTITRETGTMLGLRRVSQMWRSWEAVVTSCPVTLSSCL